MSRIHDALKKAEQERTSALPLPATTPVLLNAPAEPIAETKPSPKAAETPQILATTISTVFDFAELQRRQKPHSKWNADANSDAFGTANGSSAAEQFRTLRSRLYQYRGSHPLKTLLVTSSMSGEGKTFVTSNLVRAIVRQPERRVLVIDTDLRRPRLHTVFGAPSSPGLTDYLRGNADESAIIQQGPQGNLYLVPCGEKANHPSELLSNGRLKTLLERLAPDLTG